MSFNNNNNVSNMFLDSRLSSLINNTNPWLMNEANLSFTKEAGGRVAKRAVKMLVKRLRNLDLSSWGIGGRSIEEEEEDDENKPESDFDDLLELLEYLTLRRKLKTAMATNQLNSNDSMYFGYGNDYYDELWYFNRTNRTSLSGIHGSQEEFELPAALVQLSILVLVFLIVLFMCKCNEMMEWCRDCRRKQSIEQKHLQQQFDEER